MLKLLKEAAAHASIVGLDRRAFQFGAIGIRKDGSRVYSRNIPVNIGDYSSGCFPHAHAERRLCKKMDCGGIVYVARISKKDGSLRNARPCQYCMIAMRARSISKCYYTISDYEYGVIDFRSKEFERTFKG